MADRIHVLLEVCGTGRVIDLSLHRGEAAAWKRAEELLTLERGKAFVEEHGPLLRRRLLANRPVECAPNSVLQIKVADLHHAVPDFD